MKRRFLDRKNLSARGTLSAAVRAEIAALKSTIDKLNSELDFWFKESTLHPPPRKPKPVLTLAGLPPACKQIVKAP